MKLLRFNVNGKTRIGKLVDGKVVELSAVVGESDSMRQLLAVLPQQRQAIEQITEPSLALERVTLEAPVGDPQKYLAIGLNYKAHAEEARAAGIPIPTSQLWFNKQVSCLNAPYGVIEHPAVVEKLDYEIELGVVIGKRCRNVAAADARGVIAGYFIANDVSARDWLHRSPTFTLGKSFDSHGPVGPWITTDDEIEDPMALTMRLWVNGELRQHKSTGDMIYDIYQQIEYLSTVMTLEPGDLLATGTPEGIGAPRGLFLHDGDVVRAEIEGLGHIENRVVAVP